MSIKILDCTLRDGGYINDWEFGRKNIQITIENLSKSNIDIIECGFLDNKTGKADNFTRFRTFDDANNMVKNKNSNNSLIVAMIEHGKYNIDTLPKVNENTCIKGIRYSFRKSDFKDSIKNMNLIKEKGYKLFIQPISTNSYSDNELLELLELVNKLSPYSVYIVDTQGSMFKDDFRRLYYQFDKYLNNKILIGFHSHNNMQLSYSIAVDFIEISKSRNIIIDASIYGMGRGAGNLNTELLANYINKKIDNKYDINIILNLIDKYYYALYKKNTWGYSLIHFLSASLECHPNYASFLLNKKHLSINEIGKILLEIPKEIAFEFNKNILEDIYFKFNLKNTKNINEPIFNKNKKLLIIGSGKNINTKIDFINKNKNNYTIISLNHIPNDIDIDYVFFNSQKRFNEFESIVKYSKVIISSDLNITSAKYVLDYKSIITIDGENNDNSAVMMINYILKQNFNYVEIAGVDGFTIDVNNYNYNELDSVVDKVAIESLNKYILDGLKLLSNKINISFLTDSIFKEELKKRIIGIIPARFASTRLPGKPLVDINGIPMIIHVLKRTLMSKYLDDVIVATDDKRILDEVVKFGGKAVLTSESHSNGSERMYEVSQSFNADIYVLINGDEALLNPKHIDLGVQALYNNTSSGVSLLYNKFEKRNSISDFKVVINNKKEIMYISRSDIPNDNRNNIDYLLKAYHIMSFTKEMLEIYINLDQTGYDFTESHELLRLLENGYKIQGVEVESSAISVDTKEDLEFVREMMKTDKLFSLYKDI